MSVEAGDTERLLRLLFMQADLINSLVAAGAPGAEIPAGVTLQQAKETYAGRVIRFYVNAYGGNVSAAAARLGMSRSGVHVAMKRHGFTRKVAA